MIQGLEQFKQRFSDAKRYVALSEEPLPRQLTVFNLTASSNSTYPFLPSLRVLRLLRGRQPLDHQFPQRQPNLHLVAMW